MRRRCNKESIVRRRTNRREWSLSSRAERERISLWEFDESPLSWLSDDNRPTTTTTTTSKTIEMARYSGTLSTSTAAGHRDETRHSLCSGMRKGIAPANGSWPFVLFLFQFLISSLRVAAVADGFADQWTAQSTLLRDFLSYYLSSREGEIFAQRQTKFIGQ